MADTTEALARTHGVSVEAVRVLQDALRRGGGRQAQFSHAELGGMGQWSNGMTQVGDMFNIALRDKVDAICTALAGEAAHSPAPPPPDLHARLVAGRARPPVGERQPEWDALRLLPRGASRGGGAGRARSPSTTAASTASPACRSNRAGRRS